MPEGANTPNRYVMHSMTISNNEGYQLDIKQIYQDFMISESIYSNHIGGYVTVIDGSNVFNRIGFTGQEYIRIHFSGIEGIDTEVPFEEQVDITCRIHKVSAMKKTTDGNTRQYKLYFITSLDLIFCIDKLFPKQLIKCFNLGLYEPFKVFCLTFLITFLNNR